MLQLTVGNTYNSVLTVHVVSAGVEISVCLKAGELFLLGSRDVVHMDIPPGTSHSPPSSHHDPLLELDGTSIAGNVDYI